MANPTLSPIYDRLNGTDNYHPFTADTFADWTSEAGDTVRITRDGTEYAAPIHSQTIVWRGQHQISMTSEGTKDREPIERTSNRKYSATSAGRSEARTVAGKTYQFEVNEQHLLYVVEDPDNGLVHNLEVTAGNLTSEITRATQAEGGLATDISLLDQDISGIRTTVGTIEGQVTTLDGTVSTITGSALWTQRNDITGVVGEFDVIEDSSTHEKRLVVKSGGGLKIERNNVEYGVYDNGSLTAGVVATIVNGTPSTYIYGSNIVMSSTDNTPVNVEIAGKLEVTDITAQLISSVIADISLVTVQSMVVNSGGYINSNGYIYAPEFVIGSNSSGGGSNKYVSNAITELQVVETSSGSGTYKIQKKDFGDSSWVDVTGTFNGAAAGWTAAYQKVVWPSQNTSTASMTVKAPAATQSSTPNQQTVEYTVSSDENIAYIKQGAVIMAQYTHNQNASGQLTGWSEAYAKVNWPSQNTSTATMTVKAPAATKATNPNQQTVEYTVSSDENIAYIKQGAVVMAQYTHNQNASGQLTGWSEAYAKVSWPSQNTSTASMTVKAPAATKATNPNQQTVEYTVSSDANVAYIKQGTVIMAQVTHNQNASGQLTGWSEAYGKVSWPGQNTSSASMTVKAPAATKATNPNQQSVTYTLSSDNNVAYIKQGATVVAQLTHNKYTSGYDSAKLSGSWSNNVFTVTKGTSGSATSVSTTITADLTYDSSTHKYTPRAKTGDTVRATGSASGTQAYDAGYSAGNTAGYSSGYSNGYSNGSPKSSVTIGSNVTGTTYNCTITRNDNTTVAGTINVGSAEYNRGWNAYRSTLLSSSNNNTYLYYGTYYGTLYVAPTGGATPVYYCVGYATGFDIPAAK